MTHKIISQAPKRIPRRSGDGDEHVEGHVDRLRDEDYERARGALVHRVREFSGEFVADRQRGLRQRDRQHQH